MSEIKKIITPHFFTWKKSFDYSITHTTRLEAVISEKLVSIGSDCGVISAVAELRFGNTTVLYLEAVPYTLNVQYQPQ